MKAVLRTAVGLCVALTVGACFHQVVQTGLSPSSTVVDKPFVATWLWGLVPAAEVDARPSCPGGVAVIETQQNFLDGLVGVLTLGIFTPQDVTITCATGRAALLRPHREITVGGEASAADREAALSAAVEAALSTREPVVLRY